MKKILLLLLLFMPGVCFAIGSIGMHVGYIRGVGINVTYIPVPDFWESEDIQYDFSIGLLGSFYSVIDIAGGIYYRRHILGRAHYMSGMSGDNFGFELGVSLGGRFRLELSYLWSHDYLYNSPVGVPMLSILYKFTNTDAFRHISRDRLSF